MREIVKLNTLNTILGYLKSHVLNALPFSAGGRSVQSIYNYVSVHDLVRTSGQPSQRQLAAIAETGITTVLNLAPHHAENALPDEAGDVKALGMEYVHLPVDFRNPTEKNFKDFCALMQRHSFESLWVHCAANMRVSAFVYRYRVQCLDTPSQQANADLQKIWQPFGVWKKFVGGAHA